MNAHTHSRATATATGEGLQALHTHYQQPLFMGRSWHTQHTLPASTARLLTAHTRKWPASIAVRWQHTLPASTVAPAVPAHLVCVSEEEAGAAVGQVMPPHTGQSRNGPAVLQQTAQHHRHAQQLLLPIWGWGRGRPGGRVHSAVRGGDSVLP